VDKNEDVEKISHFTCHYLNGKLCVEMEIVIGSNMRINEVQEICRELQKDILRKVPAIHHIDIHLELQLHTPPSLTD